MKRYQEYLVFAVLAGGAMACTGPDSEGRQANAAQQTRAQEASAHVIDWKAVERAMGRPGSRQPGNVYRFSLPRSDLQVTAAGVRIKPALALGSWVAFKAAGNGAIAMGDLVLPEHEVAPVMSKLQEAGVEQTALHNHLIGEEPRLFFMHFRAEGDALRLARGLRAALEKTNSAPAQRE